MGSGNMRSRVALREKAEHTLAVMIYYTGIDYHKRYSVACTLDAQGHKIREARIDANAPAAFAAYFKALDKPSKVTMEACWNWGVLHDLLETLDNVVEVILSNPAKNRIIAFVDAQKRPLRRILPGDSLAR